ncbi:SH3 domain-containing protein [Listeria booriae]|uniref:N-acetylmuramoyl-L-alanine amidase n=1 Tax=Listeria booriae TaxID=1552123 RepID=A0A842CU77_9LIST|nr:N-acetylmuramoyl-L-alanine amidase [Listeria booriae]MBC2004626.1 SH3 domain-containing protein [Listeria booriae]
MAQVNGIEFKQNLVPASKYPIKCPNLMVAKKITVHNTYNDAKAENEVSYEVTNANQVSFHVAVDDNCAIQGIPFNRNAWHCGDGSNGFGNRNTIGVEICYSKSGGSKYTKSEQNAIKYIAGLCVQQGIVASKDTIKKHQDWSGKYCPHRVLDDKRWDSLQGAIIAEYARITKKPEPAAKGKKRVWVKEPKGLNIRTGGDWNTKVAFNLPYTYTAVIDYDQTKNGFVKVIWGDKEGWFSAAFDAYWFDKDPCTEYICQTGLNFRAGQDWNTKVVQSRKKGDVVRVIGQVNKWYKVVLSGGVVGYIPVNNLYLKKK